jgi:hypothetical protein
MGCLIAQWVAREVKRTTRRATSHYPSNRSDGQSDRLFVFTPPLLLYQPLVIKAVPLPPYLTAIPPSPPTSFYL